MNTYQTFYPLLFIKEDDDESPILDPLNIVQFFVHNIKKTTFYMTHRFTNDTTNDIMGIILGSYEG